MVLRECITPICQAITLVQALGNDSQRAEGSPSIWMIFVDGMRCFLLGSLSSSLYKIVLQSFKHCMSRSCQEKLEFISACHDFHSIKCMLILSLFKLVFDHCMPRFLP